MKYWLNWTSIWTSALGSSRKWNLW